MSKQLEARSSSSTSSAELPPLSLATNSDTPISDGEERLSSGSRERTNSLSRPEVSSYERATKQSRRRSEQVEPRLRGSPNSETTRSSLPDLIATINEEPSPRRIPYGFVDIDTDVSSVDHSFLTSTLQSINRLKEEKEVVFEDGVLKGGSITAIVLRLIEDAGTLSNLLQMDPFPGHVVQSPCIHLILTTSSVFGSR